MSNRQEVTDQKEWENSDSWTTIYFSKKDSRSIVPKKNPNHGWTINFGHLKGEKWIYYLLLIMFGIGFLTGIGGGFGLAN